MRRFFIAPVIASACLAQPPCEMEELVNIGGEFGQVSRGEQAGLVGLLSGRLVALDLSDPAQPRMGGEVQGLRSHLHEFAGDHALIAEGDTLHIVDLSDPASPVRLGSAVPLPGEPIAQRPAVDGSVAYTAHLTEPPTIVSIDFSDPANPAVLDSARGRGVATRIHLSAAGGVVAVSLNLSDQDNLLWFIDATDPADLQPAAATNAVRGPAMVATTGPVTYVYDGQYVAVIDSSDPHAPTVIGPLLWERYPLLTYFPESLRVVGDTLAVAFGHHNWGGALHVFDISNPAQPQPLDHIQLQYPPQSFSAGPRGALVRLNRDVHTMRLHPTPGIEGSLTAPHGWIAQAAIADDRLLLAARTGLFVYDLADPRSPQRFGFAPYHSASTSVALGAFGDLAYLREDTLRVYDVSTPGEPTLISSTGIPCALRLDAHRDAAIGWCPGGASVVDLADPANPTASPKLTFPADPRDAAIHGTRAIVAAGDDLFILDVTDRAAPAIAGTHPLRARSVAIDGGTAYAASMSGHITVLNVTDPTTPAPISTIPATVFVVGDLAVGGRRLLASHGSRRPGLTVYDVSDPASPATVGTYEGWGVHSASSGRGGLVALGRLGAGVSLSRIRCYADCDGDGVLDFLDFLCFQDAFLAGDPYADCDGDGRLTFFDFLCFQDAFLADCP